MIVFLSGVGKPNPSEYLGSCQNTRPDKLCDKMSRVALIAM